jgi:hypothetical protein
MQDFAGLGQMCYVVRDLEDAVEQWTAVYGAGPFFVGEFEVSGQHYRGTPIVSHVRVGVSFCGPINIELLEPLGAGPTLFHETLEQRGAGLHHFWRRSEDFDREIKRYATLGFPVVAGGNWPAVGRTAFVDTRSAVGAFTEVLEGSELLYSTLARIRAAHLNWDGQRPVRVYSELG